MYPVAPVIKTRRESAALGSTWTLSKFRISEIDAAIPGLGSNADNVVPTALEV